MKFKNILLVLAVLLSAAGAGNAGVPGRIGYQGLLTDGGGNPLTGNFDLTFRIYDDSVGGNVVYQETQSGVAVTDGLFSVLIGGFSFLFPLDNFVFVGRDRYLGIQINSDPEMSPRSRLVTSPYAFRVETVDSAFGGTIQGDLQTSGSINAGSDFSLGGQVTSDLILSNGDIGIGTTPSPAVGYRGIAVEGTNASVLHLLLPTIAGYRIEALDDDGDNWGALRVSDANGAVRFQIDESSVLSKEDFTVEGDIGVGAAPVVGGGLSSRGIDIQGGTAAVVELNLATVAGFILTAEDDADGIVGQLRISDENGANYFLFDSPENVSIKDLRVQGNLCATGTIGACSDIRFKSDVQRLSGSLDKVLSLQGISYRWRQEEFPGRQFDAQTHTGFIAQDVQRLFPDMVDTDSEGYEYVDYARLTPVLVEAIKEQQQQIDELKALVRQLIENQGPGSDAAPTSSL